MRSLRRLLVSGGLSLVALAACAPATQRVYVAPSNDTVRSSVEQGYGDPPAQLIWVQNLSTVPVVVFGLALQACENVRQSCDPMRTNILIGPGQRRLVLRVEARDRQRGFTYRYTFSWRVASQ